MSHRIRPQGLANGRFFSYVYSMLNYLVRISMVNARHYEALDGLRGIAAFAVVIFHFSSISNPGLIPHGGLAVDFFFVMSGFVVGFAYEERLRTTLTPYEFIKIRLIRLYPLLFVGAILGLIGYSKSYPSTIAPAILITGLLLIPTPLAPIREGLNAVPVNPPEWSLVFEVFGNAVYSFIAPRLSNARLICGIVTSALAYEFAFWYYAGHEFGYSWPTLVGGIPRFGVSFLIGIGVFRVIQKNNSFSPNISFISLAGFLIISFCTPVAGDYIWAYDSLCVLVIYPVVVFIAVKIRMDKYRKLCSLAGQLSYPAYILQGGFVPHVKALPSHMGVSGINAFGLLLVAGVIYMGFAWAVLILWDIPVRRWLTRRFLKARPETS